MSARFARATGMADLKILIVEDNPLIANAIERAGEELQMRADHASDGWQAIEKLEAGDYDAIVIDADLPLHSGFGVLTYLREEVGAGFANVLLMTSADHGELQRKVDDRVSIISRTDEVAELAQAVRRVVSC